MRRTPGRMWIPGACREQEFPGPSFYLARAWQLICTNTFRRRRFRRHRLRRGRLRLEEGPWPQTSHGRTLDSCRRRRTLGGLRRHVGTRLLYRCPSRDSPWRQRLVCSLVGVGDQRWSRRGVEVVGLGEAVETGFVVDPGRVSTDGVGMEGVVGMRLGGMRLGGMCLDVVAGLDILVAGSGILGVAMVLEALLVWIVVVDDRLPSLAD